MKKLFLVVIAVLLMIVPNIAYAEAESVTVEDARVEKIYKVYIDGVEQPFTGKLDTYVILPLDATYKALGGQLKSDKTKMIDTYTFENETIKVHLEELEIYSSSYFLSDAIDEAGVLYGDEFAFDTNNMIMNVNDENQSVHIVTFDGIMERMKAKNAELRAEAPELFAAFSKTTNGGYSFNRNVNATIQVDSDDEEKRAALPFQKIFMNGYMNGYMNIPKNTLQLLLDVRFDMDSAAIEMKDIDFRVVDDNVYVYDPLEDEWDKASIQDDEFFNMSATFMMDEESVFVGFIKDYMTKKQGADGVTIYTFILDEAAIETIVDDISYKGLYKEFLKELEAEGMNYNLTKAEITFMIKDEKILADHMELIMDVTMDEEMMKFNISLDSEYYSYGLEKEIEVPKEFESTEE